MLSSVQDRSTFTDNEELAIDFYIEINKSLRPRYLAAFEVRAEWDERMALTSSLREP